MEPVAEEADNIGGVVATQVLFDVAVFGQREVVLYDLAGGAGSRHDISPS
jgi:hypothetical protein